MLEIEKEEKSIKSYTDSQEERGPFRVLGDEIGP